MPKQLKKNKYRNRTFFRISKVVGKIVCGFVERERGGFSQALQLPIKRFPNNTKLDKGQTFYCHANARIGRKIIFKK